MNPNVVFATIVALALLHLAHCGLLYPQESEFREVRSLDGIWAFRRENKAEDDAGPRGFTEKWFTTELESFGPVEMMPVPSSYNDVCQDKETRDHIGWVWYGTRFRVPERWLEDRVFLRFGSANYFAVVWVNGEHVMNHTGGHLPFAAEVTPFVRSDQENVLIVALDNTLSSTTIPQGSLHKPNDPSRYPANFVSQSYNFDYFHYAGIHRPVYLYTTPKVFISDVTVTTEIVTAAPEPMAYVRYNALYKTGLSSNSIYSSANASCIVAIRDEDNKKVAVSEGCSGAVAIKRPHLWWPYLSQPAKEKAGYQYTLEVHLTSDIYGPSQDVYRQKFGIRSVEVNATGFFINNQRFYFRGFGRHEDYSIRGRGVDPVLLVKDHNLLMWTGANSYRTSHYPYAEEILDLTDRLGIVVIDESPAIGLSGFGDKLRHNHELVMEELVQRDKNRPSVVMWSIGNEPKSMQNTSREYFERVISLTRRVDPQKRPCTIVLSEGFHNNTGPYNLDVVSINRYFAWYGDTGRPEVIRLQIPTEVQHWHKIYKLPVLITEYGAGSIAGFHTNPSFVWTEDYQVDYLWEHFAAFDELRRNSNYFLGEMIWNFADFATPPETFRPWGCMKGVFTRDRLPKAAAHVVRYRYWMLANKMHSAPLPTDLRYG